MITVDTCIGYTILTGVSPIPGFYIGIMLNSQNLLVFSDVSKTCSATVRQQHLRCNYIQFELKIPIIFRYVLNCPIGMIGNGTNEAL